MAHGRHSDDSHIRIGLVLHHLVRARVDVAHPTVDGRLDRSVPRRSGAVSLVMGQQRGPQTVEGEEGGSA